ncbi:flagellin [Klenkia marina]|uniref:Flagellin n=1 Tax=Klenkia marina TaxID=1960309 RepID=A0A1G4XBM9_9ACTN|nr:flagellin [Klenkia marina]SCX38344.1 flagellin [Klenkia marina]
MGMRINTNTAAMNAYRNLSVNDSAMSKSLEKLSSGLRINRAADDAAGLAISEGLKSQIGGLKVATRNTQDGISVVQTAEGALATTQNILQRMRDLAVQAANDSNDGSARTSIANEVTSLRDELSRIADSTNFNGKKLLDGTTASLDFQVGANGDTASKITVNLATANVSTIATTLTSGGAGTSFAVDTPTAVTGNLAFIADGNTTTVAMGAAGTYKTVQSVADKLNSDASFQQRFTASVDKDNKLQVVARTGSALTVTAPGTGVAAGTANTGGLSFADAASARTSITTINTQIGLVSTARAALGAIQNRFESTIANLNIAVENLSASNSRIVDVDMASEMTEFSKNQILVQAGTSMLAQANQSSQSVLKLLQ